MSVAVGARIYARRPFLGTNFEEIAKGALPRTPSKRSSRIFPSTRSGE